MARLFRKSLCNLIPRIEGLQEGDVRFDGLLDLVKRETEFAGRTAWPPAPRVDNLRGKYHSRCESILASQA